VGWCRVVTVVVHVVVWWCKVVRMVRR
jgi:hypothetical protein